jgi:hypothetical protein
VRLTIVNELLRDDAGAGPVRLRRGGAGQLSEHGGAILLGIVLPCYGIPRRVHRGREGLFIPASYAIMPSLLSGDQLAAGNALSTAMVQAARYSAQPSAVPWSPLPTHRRQLSRWTLPRSVYRL